jgi:CRISPR-associated exonuclease Cas4
MEKLLNQAIEEFLRRKIKEREQNVFYPSELSYCLRRNYYLYKKPKELTLEVLKIFESGILVHNWFTNVLMNYFQKGKIKVFDYEGKCDYVEKEFTIKGRFDDIIALELNGETKLIEFKTVRNLDFIDEPKDHHFMQINFYLKFLGLDKGYIVYVDRRNLNLKSFEVFYSEEKFNELIKRARILFEHLKNNKLPFPEARTNKELSWMCSYCPYYDECYEEKE